MEDGATMNQVEVAFCDNSLYFSGLAASLQIDNTQFRVHVLDQPLTRAMPELKMLCPNVVVLAVADDMPEVANTLRQLDSCRAIIVVNPERGELEVCSAEQSFVTSVESLANVILNVAGKGTHSEGPVYSKIKI